MSLRTMMSGLALMLVALGCFYSQGQSGAPGVLKGTVRDQVTKATIGGVKVKVLSTSGGMRGTTITGKDGRYTVSGLVLGESVNAVYSATGYAPDPWSRPVTISKPETIQDVPLLCNCTDAAYWKTWVDFQKVWADKNTPAAADRVRVLEESWRVLGYVGVSAEARGAAASILIKTEPLTGQSTAIAGFAATNPMVLRNTEESLRVTLNGGVTERHDPVSPEIAGEIAAVEVRKQNKAEGKNLSQAADKLDSVWGPQTRKYTVTIIEKDPDIKKVAGRVMME